MTNDSRPDGAPDQDYRTLPAPVRLEDTIAGVDPDAPLDPDAVRNLDQHQALRDD